MSEFKFEEPHITKYNVDSICVGDVAKVQLPVIVSFHWADDIISDYDEETGEVEYTSGWVMRLLPEFNKEFVYKGETIHLVANTRPESD